MVQFNKYFIITIAVVIFAAAAYFFSTPQLVPTDTQVPITLLINYSDGRVDTLNLRVQNGTTVFDVMQANTKITYSTHPQWGAFIKSINRVENTNTKFWQYYVDGKLAEVGVSQYKITTQIRIEFRFELPSPELT